MASHFVTRPAFGRHAEAIQDAAQAMLENPAITSLDPTVALEAEPQVEALVVRMGLRAAKVPDDFGRQRAFEFSIGSGANNCQAALRGIILAVNGQGSRIHRTPELAGIALRSFGVVRQHAIKQSADYCYHPKIVPPEQLSFVEEPVAYVRPSEAVEGENLCPAFRGTPRGLPRLPAQIWSHVISIYEACGEFEQDQMNRLTIGYLTSAEYRNGPCSGI